MRKVRTGIISAMVALSAGLVMTGTPSLAADPDAIFETAAADVLFWRAMGASPDAAQLTSYLTHFPEGRFAENARQALVAQGRSATVTAASGSAVRHCVDEGRLRNASKSKADWARVLENCKQAIKSAGDNLAVISAHSLALDFNREPDASAQLLHRTWTSGAARPEDYGHFAYLLGRAHRKEKFPPFQHNNAKAYELYQIAARAGVSTAIVNMGFNRENGLGVDKDKAAACKLYGIAKKSGNAHGSVNYVQTCAEQLKDGEWVDTVLWAANTGNNHARFTYAKHLVEKGDERQALKYYRQAAETDHFGSQFALGIKLSDPKSENKNYQEAIHWYQKVMARGSASAHHNIANMVITERGFTTHIRAIYYHFSMARKLNPENKYHRKAAEKYAAKLSGKEIKTIDRFVDQSSDTGLLYAAIADQVEADLNEGKVESTPTGSSFLGRLEKFGEAEELLSSELAFLYSLRTPRDVCRPYSERYADVLRAGQNYRTLAKNMIKGYGRKAPIKAGDVQRDLKAWQKCYRAINNELEQRMSYVLSTFGVREGEIPENVPADEYVKWDRKTYDLWGEMDGARSTVATFATLLNKQLTEFCSVSGNKCDSP